MKCFVCGKFFNEWGGGGRPKTYCSDNCRDYQKFFNALQKSIDLMSPTNEAKRLLRGQLFGMANTIQITASGRNGTKRPGIKNDT